MKLFYPLAMGLQLYRRGFLIVLLAFSAALIPSFSTAQTDTNPANCNEITEPDMQFQADLCKAHAGCNLVYTIHNTCVKAKKFLTNLKEAIGEGTKSFFGFKKEITPEAVWQANLSESAKELGRKAEWREYLNLVDSVAKPNLKETALTQTLAGNQIVRYGNLENNNLQGYGIQFTSTGEMNRGNYTNGRLTGSGDIVYSNQTRATGQFFEGKLNGMGISSHPNGAVSNGFIENGFIKNGTYTFSNGVSWTGSFTSDNGLSFEKGEKRRTDGSIIESGTFDKSGQLDVGKKFSPYGRVTEEVDKAKERELLASAQRAKEAEADRKKASENQAAEQRRKDGIVRVEQDYRNSLNTLNAGQLFAKADELSTSGDNTKARDVLRALVSRFLTILWLLVLRNKWLG